MKIKVFEFEIFGDDETYEIENRVNSFIESRDCLKVIDVKTHLSPVKLLDKNVSTASRIKNVLIITITYKSKQD